MAGIIQMKLVLILCLFYLANVSANTELLKITEKKSGQRDAFDQRFNYQLGKNYSSNFTAVLSNGKHSYYNKIIFDANKLTFPLLIYDPVPSKIKLSLNHSSLSSDKNTLAQKIIKQLFTGFKHKGKFIIR